MAVIVHDGMPIEKALKLLWREANREDIPKVLLEQRYRVKESKKRHELRKVWAKMKRRRRSVKRKNIRKGK